MLQREEFHHCVGADPCEKLLNSKGILVYDQGECNNYITLIKDSQFDLLKKIQETSKRKINIEDI